MFPASSIPSRLLLQPSRIAMAESQKRLAEAQVEAATGRHNDVGLRLGGRTGTDLSFRLQSAEIEQATSSMQQASLKAETAQTALFAMSTLADRFRSTVGGARNASNGRTLSAEFAASTLDSLHSVVSVTQDGQYLFSGLASEAPPLTEYSAGPRQALIDAFQSTFGFAPDDTAAAGLNSSQISDFIDGAFSSLFTGTGWSTTWSAASDETQKFRLPSGESVDLSATANSAFAQTLTKSLTIMELLGNSKIGAEALMAASDKAMSLASQAQIQIVSEQARIGIEQVRLKDTQVVLDQRKLNLTKAVTALESVDPYEAAVRVNLLMTQLEGSYALTSRISRMSLLSYL
ncbi:MAG: flagellar hook-associated family protein [Aestuariivirga sp.]|uniref:flagellar hook-associated family protein n=1 Tax=Aestuariivirga sp. TaxID=2650926 RepID=UPI00301AEF2F